MKSNRHFLCFKEFQFYFHFNNTSTAPQQGATNVVIIHINENADLKIKEIKCFQQTSSSLNILTITRQFSKTTCSPILAILVESFRIQMVFNSRIGCSVYNCNFFLTIHFNNLFCITSSLFQFTMFTFEIYNNSPPSSNYIVTTYFLILIPENSKTKVE